MENEKHTELDSRHSFKLGISFLVWLGISLFSVGLVLVTVYKNPENIFKGYEDAKTTLTIAVSVISLIVSGIALYINWITTSLLLFAGFRAGKNKEVTYRSVLYYFLKNSWVFAIWITLTLLGTIFFGTHFITSVAGIIIAGVCMFALYMLILMKIKKDFPLKNEWVYIIFALVITAVIVISLIYTGKTDYAGELGTKI